MKMQNLETSLMEKYRLTIDALLSGHAEAECPFLQVRVASLQELIGDLAMPLDLVDPASKMDYFTAATMLTKAANAGTDVSQLATIPFWEKISSF